MRGSGRLRQDRPLRRRRCFFSVVHWRSDVEAEHHAALVVFGDMAVRHPTTRVRDVEQDVNGLAGTDKDSVLPNEVWFHDIVAGEDEEATGPVDVERVWHRMI